LLAAGADLAFPEGRFFRVVAFFAPPEAAATSR
jgi:hypothetical protein